MATRKKPAVEVPVDRMAHVKIEGLKSDIKSMRDDIFHLSRGEVLNTRCSPSFWEKPEPEKECVAYAVAPPIYIYRVKLKEHDRESRLRADEVLEGQTHLVFKLESKTVARFDLDHVSGWWVERRLIEVPMA